MIKGVIFDFNRTLYNPDTNALNEGALELLEKLASSGYKLCLLSKKSEEERKDKILRLGIEKYFIFIEVVEGEKTEKNFKKCLEIMALQSQKVAVIGDRIRSEIILGNQFGMRTIWYKVGKFAAELPRNKNENPNFVIDNLLDALKYL